MAPPLYTMSDLYPVHFIPRPFYALSALYPVLFYTLSAFDKFYCINVLVMIFFFVVMMDVFLYLNELYLWLNQAK